MLQGIAHNQWSPKKARMLVAALLFVLFLVAMSFPLGVHAQDTLGVQPVEDTIALGGADIRVVVARIIRAVLGLLGIIAVAIVMYGGFLWMTSGGNEQQITRAKQVLTNGLIGLVIILSAFAITQFVLSRLLAATKGGGVFEQPPPQQTPVALRSSGLGSVIEDHYPERGASSIPRNTKIMVTFVEPMDRTTLASDSNGNGTVGDCVQNAQAQFVCDTVNADNIKVSVRGEEETGPFITEADATITPDGRTVVIKPRQPLGSSVDEVSYTVLLGSGIKRADGTNAFSGFEDSYEWFFTVGTFLDLDPPFVKDFTPSTQLGPVQKNRLVQVTFNEAMDPTFLAGSTENVRFILLERFGGGANAMVPGRFEVSNGYTTVTFVPNEACGENTCGQTIYCLPGNAQIRPLLYTALLKNAGVAEAVPGTGIVDAADNALSGDGLRGRAGNAQRAEGPPQNSIRAADGTPTRSPADLNADNFYFEFSTSDEMDLTPPQVTAFSPDPNAQDIERSSSAQVSFSEEMYYTSLVQHSRLESFDLQAPVAFVRRMDKVQPDNQAPFTMLTLRTGVELPDDTIFAGRLESNIQDLGQNCFFPSAVRYPATTQCRSVDNGGNVQRATPSCCNTTASGVERCVFNFAQ